MKNRKSNLQTESPSIEKKHAKSHREDGEWGSQGVISALEREKNHIKKPLCPRCRNRINVVEVVYGFPTDETMRQAEEGKLKLGGCVIKKDNPDWHCKKCQLDFKK